MNDLELASLIGGMIGSFVLGTLISLAVYPLAKKLTKPPRIPSQFVTCLVVSSPL